MEEVCSVAETGSWGRRLSTQPYTAHLTAAEGRGAGWPVHTQTEQAMQCCSQTVGMPACAPAQT